MTDDTKAALTDPTTNEVLLMKRDPTLGGWLPDLTAMAAYRAGSLNVYRPGPPGTAIFTTTTTHTQPTRWRPMTALEDSDNDILATMSRPWIERGTIVTEVNESDIPLVDALLRSPQGDPVQAQPPPPPPEAYSRDPATRLNALLTLAEAAAAAPPAYASRGGDWLRGPILDNTDAPLELLWRLQEPEPEPTAPPEQTPRPYPMPKHVAELVIRQAVETAATCPITLEPIHQATAAVTSCGHVFAATAIRPWIAAHGTCPECRQPAVST
jgi:hypothetical protein